MRAGRPARPRIRCLATSAAVLSAGLLVGACGGGREAPPPPPDPAGESPAPEGDATSAETPPVLREAIVLFASAADERLHAQTRRIFWTAGVEDRAKQVLTELISGPEEGLLPVLPPGARLREFYLLPDGTAFADFSREIRTNPAGSASEILAVYAIVNTLALNFPEVERVGILIEGEEVETLTGHVDLRYPFEPRGSVLDPGLARRLRRR